ncbi:MAG: metallophosphoesterase [Casimicrobiaceae bacterium]
MSVVLHVSDPHFGTEQTPVVEALIGLARQQQPDLVVLSGDITQRARAAQFDAARRFVDRLAAPTVVIPGNHDIPLFNFVARLARPYGGFCAAFGDELEPVHRSHQLLVICLNTTRWYRHKDGEVSADQVERVSAELARASPTQLRIVVVHQPAAVLREIDAHNRLRGYGEALRRWAAAGADLVMGGHIHLPYVMTAQEVPRALWVVQAGTAVSSRVRAGTANSVNLVRWHGDAGDGLCHVEQWDYAGDQRSFVPGPCTPLRPAR